MQCQAVAGGRGATAVPSGWARFMTSGRSGGGEARRRRKRPARKGRGKPRLGRRGPTVPSGAATLSQGPPPGTATGEEGAKKNLYPVGKGLATTEHSVASTTGDASPV